MATIDPLSPFNGLTLDARNAQLAALTQEAKAARLVYLAAIKRLQEELRRVHTETRS